MQKFKNILRLSPNHCPSRDTKTSIFFTQFFTMQLGNIDSNPEIYMLCKCHTGYLSDFIVYTGADTVYLEPSITLPKPFEGYSNPSEIVLSLLEGFYNAGYNLALDNLYRSS